MQRMFIPPGGFIGAGSQTMAGQAGLGAPRAPRATSRRRAARPSGRKSRATSRRTSKRRNGARFVKGSAAARRYMAKLRRMRKK